MGNCQATDAAAAVVEHPCGRTEKLYWPITARQLMLKNPGHYVAVYAWPPCRTDGPVRPKLKLLPPTAILGVGKSYRIISFEEVMGEFSEIVNGNLKFRTFKSDSKTLFFPTTVKKDKESNGVNDSTLGVGVNLLSSAQSTNRYGQWRPSLHSISEKEW